MEAYKLAQKLSDGSIKANDYNIGILLTEYINAGGDTAFMSTPSPEMEAQATAGAEGSDSILTKDVITPLDKGTITQMKQQRIDDSIQANAQANPDGVQASLTDGMGILLYLEARLQSDSGNVNYSGFKADNANNVYVDFISGRGSMEATAQAMADDIKTATQRS